MDVCNSSLFTCICNNGMFFQCFIKLLKTLNSQKNKNIGLFGMFSDQFTKISLLERFNIKCLLLLASFVNKHMVFER